jgi:glutathione S-transferase
MKLVIGNKSVSSWSMRPWLLLKHFNIPFEEILIRLDEPQTSAEILRYSPTAKVPALEHDGDWIWESAAIMEYLAEIHPQHQMYPQDVKKRARARSLSMEMHAGFAVMRDVLSFNARKVHPGFDSSKASADIKRICEIWETAEGPFLFGEFGLVDAMYAPVVGRFQTYDVKLTGKARAYYDAMLALAAFKQWYHEASLENFVASKHA